MNHKWLLIAPVVSCVLLAGAAVSVAQEGEPLDSAEAQAIVGTGFTYQGYLEDPNGPVTDACDFRFTLWDGNPNAGGAMVSAECIVSDVIVADGYFTALVNGGGEFGVTAFNGEERWLGIAVMCSGDAMWVGLPPHVLTPAPYALALPGLWTQPNITSTNLIGGYRGNSVGPGVVGATIGGGGRSSWPNQVTASYATIGGGVGNTASDTSSTIAGGSYNTTSGNQSTVGGGGSNTASAWGATVAGGYRNTASFTFTTISGGDYNTASAWGATIGGGYTNTTSLNYATIAGGVGNTANGAWGAIGGGFYNTASGDGATVAGGGDNTASGIGSTVAGGYNNTAGGNYGLAAGRDAHADHDGSFVWADSTFGETHSPANHTFIVRADGGIWFGRGTGDLTPTIRAAAFIDTSTGGYLSTGGNWVDVSDRALKEGFTPVDGGEVLVRLAELPITTWSYKEENSGVRHMGPVAQDFYAAFGLGADDRHISALDANGVALAAIQKLYRRSQDQSARIDQLETDNAALRTENATYQEQIDDLERRMTALEGSSAVVGLGGINLPAVGWLVLGGLLVGLMWTVQRGGELSLRKGG